MARIIDESFEGTGYEEAWTETGTVDEDSSGPGSLPAGGGTQCFAVVDQTNSYATRNTGNERGTSYTRAYIYFSSLSITSTTELILIQLQASNTSNTMVVSVYNNGTNNVWRATYRSGGSWNNIVGSSAVNTGQWYRIELEKTSGGNIEFRVDGVTIGSASGITLDRGDPQYWAIGSYVNGSLTSATIYFDLIAVDDTTWVGEESSPISALPRRALDGPFYGSLRGSVR